MLNMRTLDIVDTPVNVNRFGLVGITVREARQLFKMMQQLEKMAQKDGLYSVIADKMEDIQHDIFDILNHYGRIEVVGGSE